MTAQLAFCVLGRARATALFALAAVWLTASPALAGIVIFDEVIVAKGADREAGALVGPTPYFFEVCIAGINISASTPPTVQTPPSANFPTGSVQTLSQDLDEFCFERFYGSTAARDADFPSGNYTVTATNIAETTTDSKQVNFSVASPTAYPNITTPADGGSVSTSGTTPVSWNLVDKGGCNTGQPATCLDFFAVGTFENSGGFNEVDFQILMNPAATGTTLPAGIFQAGAPYEIEVEALRGTVGDQTTDIQGATVTVFLIATDINLINVTGAQPTQPIQEVQMFKGLDRDDGVPLVDPYFIEICVTGSDIPTSPPGALPTVQTPPSVDFPTGTTEPMMFLGFEFCFEAEGFADAAALDASYPSGDYTITVTDNSQTTDTAVVSFGLSEPSGFPDVFDPVNGATIPFDQNLEVQWGSLVAKDGSCNPASPASCTDGIVVFIVDENTGNDVDIQQLPAAAGATTVSGAILQPSTPYNVEVETFRGSFAEAATSSTLGNPILLTRLYEDINILAVTTVPEPGAVAMQLAALTTLAWAARRRRRARLP